MNGLSTVLTSHSLSTVSVPGKCLLLFCSFEVRVLTIVIVLGIFFQCFLIFELGTTLPRNRLFVMLMLGRKSGNDVLLGCLKLKTK